VDLIDKGLTEYRITTGMRTGGGIKETWQEGLDRTDNIIMTIKQEDRLRF
jgi:hypothetical protein